MFGFSVVVWCMQGPYSYIPRKHLQFFWYSRTYRDVQIRDARICVYVRTISCQLTTYKSLVLDIDIKIYISQPFVFHCYASYLLSTLYSISRCGVERYISLYATVEQHSISGFSVKDFTYIA